MSQAEVKRFVEAQRKDKWNEILRVIGLQVLAEFRDDLFKITVDKKNDSLFIEAKLFCDQIVAELKQFKNTGKIISAIGKYPYSKEEIIQSIAQSLGITDPSSFNVKELQKTIRTRMEKIIKPESLATLDIPTDTLSSTTVKSALKHMDAVLQLFSQRTHIDKDFIEFISMGLKYVSDTTCPFCKEKTLTKKRRKELQQLLNISQKKLELESQLEKEIADQKDELQFVAAVVQDFVSKKRQLPSIVEMLEKTGRYTEDVQRLSEMSKTMFDDLEKMLESLKLRLQKYLVTCEGYFSGELKYDAPELERLKQNVEQTIQKIWRLTSKRSSDLAQIRQSILLKTTDIDASLKLLRKLLCLEKLLSKMDLIGTAVAFKESIDTLDKLWRSLEKFEKKKAHQLLRALSKDVKAYYNILNPKEGVTFSEMVPSTGKTRWVVIKGNSYGEELNPISCFSESHLNCLGLSLYFTQRVDKNPFWNLVILDDPVQSMDDRHSSNLVDIIAEICKKKGKQVIVLTHQKSFADVIKSKFYYDDYLYYVLSTRNEQGPDIKLTKGSLENFIDRARILARGTQDDVNDGGVNLRKGIEKFCFDVLTLKYGRRTKRIRELDLENLFKELEKVKEFDKQDIADLRTVRLKVDLGAHGNVKANVSQGDLDRGVAIVERLKKKYLG